MQMFPLCKQPEADLPRVDRSVGSSNPVCHARCQSIDPARSALPNLASHNTYAEKDVLTPNNLIFIFLIREFFHAMTVKCSIRCNIM